MNQMPDIDKTISQIEHCVKDQYCGECEYKAYMICKHFLLEKALVLLKQQAELLKGQAPRVLTIEEVKSMKRLTLCVVEQRSKIHINTFNAEYCGIVTVGNRDFLDFGLYSDKDRYRRSEGGYGKTWRCWNKRPTDEQRQEVEWE